MSPWGGFGTKDIFHISQEQFTSMTPDQRLAYLIAVQEKIKSQDDDGNSETNGNDNINNTTSNPTSEAAKKAAEEAYAAGGGEGDSGGKYPF